MYGLKYRPDLGSSEANNRDFPLKCKRKVKLDFSSRNREVLLKEFLEIKDNVKTIVEIGVARLKKGATMDNVSTGVFINNKNDGTCYVGVDLEDKSFIKGPNVHTLRTSSSNTKRIMDCVEENTGERKIDVLFIDGWHSVNQVLDDWMLAEYLSDNGVVFLHDTNVHPGPVELLKAIDTNMFSIEKHCIEEDDWGIAVVKKL